MLNAQILLSRGFGINPRAVWNETEITFTEKVVLMYLLSFLGGDKQTCWPSLSRMSKELGKSAGSSGLGKTSIIRAIRGLCDKRLIEKTTPKNETESNKYRVLVAGGSPVEDCGSPVGDRGGSCRGLGGSPVGDRNININKHDHVTLTNNMSSSEKTDEHPTGCKSFDWLYTYLKSKELLPLKADKKGCTIFYKHEKERCMELETRFDPRLIIRVWKLCLDDSFWSKQRLSALKWSSYAPKFLDMARMELENITEET